MSISASSPMPAPTASMTTPLGEHAANTLRKLASSGTEMDQYAIISAGAFALTDKMPLSSVSQTSTCSSAEGSTCETLSDVSSTTSPFTERSPAEPVATPAAAGVTTSTEATQSSPVKMSNKLPSLEAIAARLNKKIDIHGDPQWDQENGSAQQQQCTPVRPIARHAFVPSRRGSITHSPSQQTRGRSEVLASLVDRACDRSRSASPVKREGVVGPTGISASGPSLHDIIKRMGSRKDLSTSVTSTPALDSSATPPPRAPSRGGQATPQAPLQRDACTGTDSANKDAVRKSPSKLDRVKPDEHPLEHRWSIYFDSKTWTAPTSQGMEQPRSPCSTSKARSWEATLKMLGRYDTVENFMTVFRTLRRPSQLERNSNYHLFKDGIKPMWEDPANMNGGKWIVTLRSSNPALLDRSWMWLVLALIGEDLDEGDDVTGAVVSTRAKGDRIALWVRDKSDVELVNRIGRRFVALLDIEHEAGVTLEFSPNSPENVGNVNFSSSAAASSVSLQSSLRQELAPKYVGFSNPIVAPVNPNFAASNDVGSFLSSMHLPAKGANTPQRVLPCAVGSNAASPLVHGPQQSLNTAYPGSPLQMQSTLGAHLRVHGSPGKAQSTVPLSLHGRSSAAMGPTPALSRRGSQQDVNGSTASALGFSKGFGGPIGRTGSPSPASNPLRNSIGASTSGGAAGFGLMNRTKA